MNLIRRHPIGAFLLATYTLVLLIFALPLLADTGLGVLAIELPGTAPFLLLSTIALAAVAFGVTAVADGRAGARELRQRAFRFRVSPAWFVLALLILPVAALAIAVVANGTTPLVAIGREPSLIVGWMVELAIAVVLINFWEEIGWTGFVLHRLQPRLGPVRATVATSWAQGAFHVPLLFIAGGLSDTRIPPEQYPFFLAALFVLPLGNRIVLTWLYNSSGHSLPVAGISHSAWNLAAGSAFLPAIIPGFEPLWAYAGFGALAVALIVVTRGRLGYEPALRASTSGAGALTPAAVSAR